MRRRLKHFPKFQARHDCSRLITTLSKSDLVFYYLDLTPRNIILLDDNTIGLLKGASVGCYPIAFEIAALLH